MLRRSIWIGVCFAVLLCCVACGGTGAAEVRQTLYCMDTVMELRLWGSDAQPAMEVACALLRQLETDWAADGPVLSALTLDPGILLTREQAAVTEKALALRLRTGGAFEPRLYGLTGLWGFTSGDYRVPTQSEIDLALGGTAWDLGAVIKGYAGDRIVSALETMDITCGLFNLGGNVQTLGTKPDGSDWSIAIRDPENASGTVGTLAVRGSTSVITSGGYQRCFTQDGVTYHHILDPHTGRPADSDLASVTVICADGMTGDALSTALFVMGYEEAVAHWRAHGDFEAVFVLENGQVWVTEGVQMTAGEYEVISH